MIVSPGDIICAEITKSRSDDDIGIRIVERKGKVWIVGVRRDGIFKRFVPIQPGDQILKVNGKRTINASTIVENGLGAKEVNRILQQEQHIELKFRRAMEGECGDYSPPFHSPL